MAGHPSALKLNKVACLLRLTWQATSRLIRLGRLPGFRVGEEWRIQWTPPAHASPDSAAESGPKD